MHIELRASCPPTFSLAGAYIYYSICKPKRKREEPLSVCNDRADIAVNNLLAAASLAQSSFSRDDGGLLRTTGHCYLDATV